MGIGNNNAVKVSCCLKLEEGKLLARYTIRRTNMEFAILTISGLVLGTVITWLRVKFDKFY